MDVGREISEQFAVIELDRMEEKLLKRRAVAMDVVRTIPSGTHDSELTPEQEKALDEYEFVNDALREVRGRIS